MSEPPKKFESNREFVGFLFQRIMAKKKWWLLPLWAVIAILAYVLNLPGKESVLPALYFIF